MLTQLQPLWYPGTMREPLPPKQLTIHRGKIFIPNIKSLTEKTTKNEKPGRNRRPSPSWAESHRPRGPVSPLASAAPQMPPHFLNWKQLQCPYWRHLGEMGGRLPLRPVPCAPRGRCPGAGWPHHVM